jgi:hypothetical protein
MCRSTFQRSLTLLTFGLFGVLMTFFVGVRLGAALNGHMSSITLGNDRMPTIPQPAPAAAAALVTPR